MRTGASAPMSASIRWRWSAPRCSSCTRGRIVSGGSTLTMQVARLLEPRQRALGLRQAAADGPRRRARAAAQQGRDPRALPDAGALRRQPRRRARRLARLFRQGAEAADPGRGRAAGRAAAVAGSPPARPSSRRGARRARPRARPHGRRPARLRATTPTQAKAEPVPRLRKPLPMLAPHAADAAVAHRQGSAASSA